MTGATAAGEAGTPAGAGAAVAGGAGFAVGSGFGAFGAVCIPFSRVASPHARGFDFSLA